MSESEKKVVKAFIVASIALMHNGKRYEVGSEIKLTDEEYSKISQYVRPAPEKSTPQIPAANADNATPDTQKENDNGQKEEKIIPQTEGKTESSEAAGDGSNSGNTDGAADTGSGNDGQSGAADADQSVQAGDGEAVTPEKPAKPAVKKGK